MRQGLAAVEAGATAPEFVLFTDADIAYAPHVLSRLVAIARATDSVLTSLMVKLRCESAAERWLAPAFVFFFQMLYPFAWVNDPRRRDGRGGGRLHARAARGAARGRRARGAARRPDRRLRARRADEAAGADLARAHRERRQPARAIRTFADFGRMVVALGLRASCAIRRCAWSARSPAWRSPISRRRCSPFSRTEPAQVGGRARLGDDGACARADAAPLSDSPLLVGLALPAIAAAYIAFTFEFGATILARARRLLEGPIPGADAGGRGAHDDGDRGALGQGPPGREFSGRLVAPRANSDAARSSPSIASRGPPTTSPTTRRSRPTRSSRCSTARRRAVRPRTPADPEAEPLRLALAETRPAARATRSISSTPSGSTCASAATPTGRSSWTIAGFGGAGRPLRARRARRGPTAFGRPPTRLCAALQVINHLQDCAEDYRAARPRLSAAGYARRARRLGRDAGGAARRRPCAARSHELAADARARLSRRRAAHPADRRRAARRSRSPRSTRSRGASRAISNAAIR